MNVCPTCFDVRGLQRRIEEIRPDHEVGKCDFHPSKKGVPVEAVAEIVDRVFRDNYGGGPYDPYSIGPRGDELVEVVQDLAQPDDWSIVEALRDALIEGDDYWPGDGEEAFYDDEYRYHADIYNAALEEPARLWRDFRRSLLHGQRFFNTDARDLLGEIFQDVHQQRDHRKKGPVYMVSPGEAQSRFSRARVANESELRDRIKANLAGELGPPPERRRRAGRLNPAGVIGFYGAFDRETCVAELRPTVGSIIVAAEFTITAPICVLDTTLFEAKPKAPDLYAKNAQQRAAQWQFMQSFMLEIAQPISPDDEHLDYLPTQAVAEYLNKHHRFTFAGAERTIDAVIYRSAQHPEGKNIVLLGEAAVVGAAPGALPEAGEDEDDWPSVTFATKRRPQARILPVDDSLIKQRVSGASFPTAPFFDAGDPWPEGANDEDY
jgi:hypothetical protein